MNHRADNPGRTDPFSLARKNASLTGDVPINEMQRLASFLAADDGSLHWEADFSRQEQADGSHQSWLALRIGATLAVPCALCGEPVTVPVDEHRRLLVVRDEQTATRLDEEAADFDVISADEGFELADLVEDEAILAIPLLVKHERCPAQADADSAPEAETRRPFAGLSDLLASGRAGNDDDSSSDN